MAEAALNIEFVWVDSDWNGTSPLSDRTGIKPAAFAVEGADARQPALSLAARQVPVGSLIGAAFEFHLSESARRRLAGGGASAAVFGRRARLSQPLYEGDRIELLGPVTADPMSERRARVQHERQESARDKWKTSP